MALLESVRDPTLQIKVKTFFRNTLFHLRKIWFSSQTGTNFFCRNRQVPSKGVARGGGPPPTIEMSFQIFRLNFSWDKFKMRYFSNKFSKIALNFSFGDLKFRDLAKLCFSNWLWRNRTITSFQWRHHHYVTEKRH